MTFFCMLNPKICDVRDVATAYGISYEPKKKKIEKLEITYSEDTQVKVEQLQKDTNRIQALKEQQRRLSLNQKKEIDQAIQEIQLKQLKIIKFIADMQEEEDMAVMMLLEQ